MPPNPVQLVAYSGYGFQSDAGGWKLRISGIAMQPPDEYNMRKRMMLRMLCNAMQVSPAETQNEIFRNRIKPFLSDAEHGLKVFVTVNGVRFRLKKKTSRSGHFQSWLGIPGKTADEMVELDSFGKRIIRFQVSANDESIEPANGVVYLLDREGTSVISDIDDTIKESFVTDRRKLLAHTFLHEFRGVDQMAELYHGWARQGVDFHYVSSSPWQLYDSLIKMQVNEGFPSGTLHLRRFRLRDQLLKKVLIIRRKGKAAEIKSIIKNMPARKFILIGDSGERDPEIYRKICFKYPDQIRGLFIRELSDRPVDQDRFRKINNSLPAGICKKFNGAKDLHEQATVILDQTKLV